MPIGGGHEEAVEFLVEHRDLRNPFRPAIAGPSGNYEAEREAVEWGQGRAVQFVSQQGVRVEGLVERNGALKLRHGSYGLIGAIEEDFASPGFDAGGLKEIGQADPGPPAVADGAVLPLQPNDARFIEGAAVAGALEDGDLFDAGQLL
jgi:hypothetical protein